MEIALDDGSTLDVEDALFADGHDIAHYDLHFSKDHEYVAKLYDPMSANAERLARQERWVKMFAQVAGRHIGPPYLVGFTQIAVGPRRGVVAKALGPGFRPLENYIHYRFWRGLGEDERGGWDYRVRAGLYLSRGLRWLHQFGLSHADLSPRSVLVRIDDGGVAILCNEDNVFVPGIHPVSVLGTPWCMAPEIHMGTAMPSANTDKHALAVLLYSTLLQRNPLLGPKIHHKDPEQDEALALGANALYIEHPTDHSNRPAELKFSGELLTPLMQAMFRRAFVDGLHNPAKRPAAAEWESAIVRMADRIVPCQKPDCMMHAFVAPELNNFKCPWCGTPYGAGLLPVAHLYRPGARRGTYDSDRWSMVALQNRPILQHHVDSRKSPDPGVPSVPVAHFEMDGRGKWYLKNDGLDDASVLETTGAAPFKSGTSVELQPGTRILFGDGPDYRLAVIRLLETPGAR